MSSTLPYYSAKLQQVAQRLQIDPRWLWLVIQHESAWKPNAINMSSGATGLIQWMPSTALAQGLTPARILAADRDTQLEWVYAYLSPYKGRMKDLDDVYFAVFYPYAIGKPDNYVIGSERGAAYAQRVASQNPANNPNKDSSITVAEVRKVMSDLARSYGISKGPGKAFSRTPELSLSNLKWFIKRS